MNQVGDYMISKMGPVGNLELVIEGVTLKSIRIFDLDMVI